MVVSRYFSMYHHVLWFAFDGGVFCCRNELRPARMAKVYLDFPLGGDGRALSAQPHRSPYFGDLLIMRIAIVSPYSAGPLRGNMTTVNRIVRHLGYAGIETVVLPVDAVSADEMELRLARFRPDLIHAFHAHYCGGIANCLAKRLDIRFVLTVTGSDIFDPALRDHPATAEAIAQAAAIACFSQTEADMVTRSFSRTAGTVVLIPQGVEQPQRSDNAVTYSGDFIVLLPAALRAVKNIESAVSALAPPWPAGRSLRLLIAGGVIEHDYASRLKKVLDDSPWAVWLGEVPFKRMGALYGAADLVLNCSHFESMPNSLLEAMAAGRPVLAADIPGNRLLVRHGETGWLYRDQADFRETVLRLADDRTLGALIGCRGQEFVLTNFPPWREAEAYRELYHSCIPGGRGTRQDPARCVM